MQVINCAAGHGQQRRQAVARRDSMAARPANSLKTSKKSREKRKKIRKNRRPRRAVGPHLPPAWVPSRAPAPPQSHPDAQGARVERQAAREDWLQSRRPRGRGMMCAWSCSGSRKLVETRLRGLCIQCSSLPSAFLSHDRLRIGRFACRVRARSFSPSPPTSIGTRNNTLRGQGGGPLDPPRQVPRADKFRAENGSASQSEATWRRQGRRRQR